MESDQRIPREITYRAGWKRGKIELGALPDTVVVPQEPSELPFEGADRLNRSFFWGELPLWRGKTLLYALAVLPAALFILFVWMIYRLSLLH